MNLICFSHLRWNFVYQRPQHLMTRFARSFRVFYVEEPKFDSNHSYLEVIETSENVIVLVSHLSPLLNDAERTEQQNRLIHYYLVSNKIERPIVWFYTPMALPYLEMISSPSLIVYDCMDELTGFKNAPVEIASYERQLMNIADLVFTGGHSLYKAKRKLNAHMYPFPSSIDKEHFGSARLSTTVEPEEQASLTRPKIGFFGVIDERLNIALLDGIATLRPDYNFIMIGPVVKIDASTLPAHDNIHYLGSKSYKELPSYLKGWDVSMIPFALNDSTTFISPTKTPEYLAGGTPVVSTSIADVVNPYGDNGLVCIADSPEEFVRGIEWGLDIKNDAAWNKAVDGYLNGMSWDNTWEQMLFHVNTRIENKPSEITTINRQLHV